MTGSRRRSYRYAALGVALCAILLGGCQPDPYCLDCLGPPADGSMTGTDATTAVDGGDAGLCPDAGDFQIDPFNCGECGNVCDVPNAFADCAGGECIVGACQVGWHDLCTDPLDTLCDGCEYGPCLTTNGGIEACDGYDNDCDGAVDEDFDLMIDPSNCGACGAFCALPQGTSDCVMGGCVLTGCDPGFYDLDPMIPGCEYPCAFDPPETEVCDAFDNDCDAITDEDDPMLGLDCGPPNIGECSAGSWTCSGGLLSCVGGVGPVIEACDGLDNDCDMMVDEDFDFDNDPAHCGGCTACMLPDTAVAGCALGMCYVLLCDPGFTDVNGIGSDGCESPCVPSGPEVCDGTDNDCNGMTDTADPGLLVPANFCRTMFGECIGTAPTCTGATGWQCLYPPTVELDPMTGQVVSEETLCDGLDNDCDSAIDEAYPSLGAICTVGNGACAGTAPFTCNMTQDGVECLAMEDLTAALPEVCNGVDDDCDALVDEVADVVDDYVNIAYTHPVFGALDFWIYTYEASRPDATAGGAGFLTARACSSPGVLPWALASWDAADAACTAAAARLCTEAEWQAACEGTPLDLWPYGSTYVVDTCNDNLYDFIPATPEDDDGVLPTGSLAACISTDGALDMSGNLKEWTATLITPDPAYRIRGGAYDSYPDGTRCDFDFAGAVFDFYFDNLGFRCCRDTPP